MFVTAITFFIILSILVFVHELGHFLVARIVGVGVEEFGFGLPPRIWGKKVKSTIYSINWLPIGGFVKLLGEDEEEEASSVKRQALSKYFWARSKKERGTILIAGVAMNFLLAVGITAYLLHQGILEPSGRVHVEQVVAGSPAQTAGIQVKDYVSSITYIVSGGKTEQKQITSSQELIDLTKTHAGETITLAISHDGENRVVYLIPRKTPPPGQGPMGVAISDLEAKIYPWQQAPWVAVKINLERARDMLVSLGTLIWRLVTLQPLQADVAGPIGIAQVTGTAVRFGVKAVLEFVSILSLNLAVLNILPFPALDGGRLAFVFLEKILGRKVRPAFERSTHQVGMMILFALILLVSVHDILRLARGGGLTP